MRTYKFYVGVLNAWKHYASIWVREKTKVRTMTYLKHTRYKTWEKMSKFSENFIKLSTKYLFSLRLVTWVTSPRYIWNIMCQKKEGNSVGPLSNNLKNYAEYMKKNLNLFGSCLQNSTANPAHFHLKWAGLTVKHLSQLFSYFQHLGINLYFENIQVRIQVGIKPDIFLRFSNLNIFPGSNMKTRLQLKF